MKDDVIFFFNEARAIPDDIFARLEAKYLDQICATFLIPARRRGTCRECNEDVAVQGAGETAVAHGSMWGCPGSGKPVKEAARTSRTADEIRLSFDEFRRL
jgi:hypothetical protein